MKRGSGIAVLGVAAVLIVLSAGQSRRVDAAQARQTTFTGRILDAGGRPIEGAKVRLYRETYGGTPYSSEVTMAAEATTEEDGSFSFSVRVESDDYRYGYVVAQREGLAIGFAPPWDMGQDQKLDITLGAPTPLAGIVVDESGKPVPDAAVSIHSLQVVRWERQYGLSARVAPQLLTTRTDGTGRFAFANLPGNVTAELLVRKPGRAAVSTFTPMGYSGGPLHYSPGQTGIRLIQPAEAKIQGIVVQKRTGQPVAGVKLVVTHANNRPLDGHDAVSSNTDGTFAIPALPAGEHVLQLVAPRDGLPDWVAAPAPITCEAGQTQADVRIEVSQGGILEVAVTDAAGNRPLERASANVRAVQGAQWFNSVSDAQGIARIRLAPGAYEMRGAIKQGYSYEAPPETITIEEGETKRVAVALTKLPKIRGIVHDSDGQPAPGVTIVILPMSREEASTDSAGAFEITWERTRGMVGRENMVYSLVARHEQRNLATTVGIDDGTDGLDVKLEPGVVLTGRVVDPNGQGIPGARIMPMMRLSSWGSSLSRSQIQTDSDGNFAIRAVPAGQRYSITASADGYGSLNTSIESLDAVDGRFDAGTWTLPAANLTVSGQVVDLQGNPAPNASIQGYGEGQPTRINTQADAQGRFTLDSVCAGRLYVQANVRQGGKDLSAQVVTDGGAADIKIVVREGRAPVQRVGGKSYEQILATATRVIAGVAVDEKGSPAAAVSVRVCCHKAMRDGRVTWMFSDFREFSATTDAQGRFAIELKEDGEYNLLFSPDRQAALIVYDVPVGKKDLKATLPEGGTVTGRLLRLEKGQKIAIPNAEVKAEQNDRASFSHLGFDRDRTTLTDSEGRFRFEHLSTLTRVDHTNPEFVPRTWKVFHGETSQTIAFEGDTTTKDIELIIKPDPAKAPPLAGRPLPGFDGIGIKVAPEQIKGKRVLVCFFDWEQRPSRNSILLLARQAESLKEKGVTIAAVSVSAASETALQAWAKESNIPFPVGTIQGDRDEVLAAWSVKSLPWLVLTDRNHVVTAEGFAPNELQSKIDAPSGK